MSIQGENCGNRSRERFMGCDGHGLGNITSNKNLLPSQSSFEWGERGARE